MKPIPVASMEAATCSGARSMLTPSASSTSALPDLLETLRLPCLATLAPAAADTNMVAVEILKVCEPSPPVPTISTKFELSATSTWRANSRITVAAAAISPIVSFFTRRPVMIAAAITGDMSPRMIIRIRCSISSWKISRCSIVRCSASCGVIVIASPLMPAGPRSRAPASGSSATARGRARRGSIRGGTARPRSAASCGARP